MRPRILAVPITALAIAASCSPSHPRAAVASPAGQEELPEVAPLPESELTKLEDAILDREGGSVFSSKPWVVTEKPIHFDYVADRIAPKHEERVAIAEHGFAVRAGDTYASWGSALRELCVQDLPLYIPAAAISRVVDPLPRGKLPSYMRSEAYAQLRSTRPVPAPAPPPSETRDCEGTDPWPWLEPAPEVYDRVAASAPNPEAKRIAEALAAIARHELEDKELTYEERRFLSFIVSTKEGWYAKLGHDANVKLTIGFFIVDTNGPARLMVGPVPASG